VSNAGKAPPDVAVEDLDVAVWNDILSELNGSFFCAKHAVRLMKRDTARGPSIVFVASTAGIRGVPLRQAYCAAKHGIVGLSRALAVELAPAIRVNCVAPGPVDTNLLRRGAEELPPDRRAAFERNVPLGRIGTPDDIAGMILHLAGDDAAWTTGLVVPMAGGKE
jgi:NAD(P)-dependent dehydrogenase (short-subunit alcohol dehydrogenase family)